MWVQEGRGIPGNFLISIIQASNINVGWQSGCLMKKRAYMPHLWGDSQLWLRGPKLLDLLFQQKPHVQILWGGRPFMLKYCSWLKFLHITVLATFGSVGHQCDTSELNFNIILSKPFRTRKHMLSKSRCLAGSFALLRVGGKVWECVLQGRPGPHAEHPFQGWYLGLGREMEAQQQQCLLPRRPWSGKRDGSSLGFLLALAGFFPLTLQ